MSSNPFVSNKVFRGLPLSDLTRRALGQDIRIVLNRISAGAVEEVRGTIRERTDLVKELERAKNWKSNDDAIFAPNIEQIRKNIRDVDAALAGFFSLVWEDANGQPIPTELVNALPGVVGAGEANKMQSETLAAIERYQSESKGQ